MKKLKAIILLVTILLPTLYQHAPAQIISNSSLNSLSPGNITSPRGTSSFNQFNRFSVGSERFRQSLSRLPNPLAAPNTVNRLVSPQTGFSPGFSRRISAYGFNSIATSAARTSSTIGMPGFGSSTRPTGLTAAGTGFNVRTARSYSSFSYTRPGRLPGGIFRPGRSLTANTSIFAPTLQPSYMRTSLIEQRGLFNLDSSALSTGSNTLVDQTNQSQLVNTRLSASYSIFGPNQSSPFLRIRRY